MVSRGIGRGVSKESVGGQKGVTGGVSRRISRG